MKQKLVTPVFIEIKNSKILPGQIGLFATRNLNKKFVIGLADKLEEKFFPWSKFSSIDNITKEKIKNYCLQTEDGFYMPQDFNYLTVPWNMNHSCSYNVGFDEAGNFVTTRKINMGEELFWDYGMGHSYPYLKFVCKCKSKNCRKIITGNDWKDDKYVKKNKKYFLRELLNKKIGRLSPHKL